MCSFLINCNATFKLFQEDQLSDILQEPSQKEQTFLPFFVLRQHCCVLVGR